MEEFDPEESDALLDAYFRLEKLYIEPDLWPRVMCKMRDFYYKFDIPDEDQKTCKECKQCVYEILGYFKPDIINDDEGDEYDYEYCTEEDENIESEELSE